MDDKALIIKNVAKQYKLGLVGTGTLSHDLNRWWHKIRGKEDPYLKIGEENDRSIEGGDYVWALRDIDLEVNKGEILGIIGRNGAGKSTLLKLLSGITTPTLGTIYQNGRLASLLEVGTGFHPELTGRENIFLNGAILGMTKSEISKKLDEIIEFSGCAKYVDTPVKRYSSGMRVRLGFAVAAYLESEILIVDEVLAVGDAEFQKKAIGKMKDVSSSGGRTVLFVSHNMASIRQLCTKVLVMNHGRVSFLGKTDEAIKFYLENDGYVEDSGVIEWKEEDAPGSKEFTLLSVKTMNGEKKLKSTFSNMEEVCIQVEARLNTDVSNMRLNFKLLTENEVVVLSASSHNSEELHKPSGTYSYSIQIPKNLLNETSYVVQLQAGMPGVKEILFETKVIKFHVEKMSDSGTTYNAKLPGVVAPDIKWSISKS